MAKKLHPIEKQMLAAQKKMSVNKKKDTKEKTPKKRKTVKEQYEEIKESMKPKVKEIDSEQELIAELFKVTDSITDELETIEQKPALKSRDCL